MEPVATYWRKAAWPWASIGLLLALAIPAIAQAWPAKVVRITDGDTITVLNRDQVQLRIRLYGIDCPERKQPFGKKAKEFVAQLAGARQVDIHGTENDRYGRVIGLVILPDGTNLNLAILDAGLGWVYRKYCTKPFCQDWLDELKIKRAKLVAVFGSTRIPYRRGIGVGSRIHDAAVITPP